MVLSSKLFSRIVSLTDLAREYPDVQTSISRDTVTGVVLGSPEVPTYIGGRLGGVWPRPDVQTSISGDTVTGVVSGSPEVPTYIGGRLGGVWPRESEPRDYQPRSNDITANTQSVISENQVDTSMERILQAPADTFSRSDFINEEHPLLGDNLARSAFCNQINAEQLTDLLMEQLPRTLLEDNVGSIVTIPEAARLANFDNNCRLRLAHTMATYLEGRGVSSDSLHSNAMPRISLYARVLRDFIRCIRNALPDMNSIIRDVSTLRVTLPADIPEHFADPIFDQSLFVLLERTFQMHPAFFSETITFFYSLNPIAIISFGMFFSRLFSFFSDFNFRMSGGNHLDDFSIGGFYTRIRTTVSIFGLLRERAYNRICLRVTNLVDNLERVNRNFQNATRYFSTVSRGLSSRISALLYTFPLSALIGILSSFGFYYFRNELAEFLRKIIKPPGAVTGSGPKSLIYCLAKSLIYCIGKGLASGWKEWWDSQS